MKIQQKLQEQSLLNSYSESQLSTPHSTAFELSKDFIKLNQWIKTTANDLEALTQPLKTLHESVQQTKEISEKYPEI
jgi:hypothetical protein